MKAHVKFISILLILLLSLPIKAGIFEDASNAYSNGDYEKAVNLLNQEIKKNPQNAEAYKLLGKSYEGLFEIQKSLDAYNKYEELKRNGLNQSTKPTVKPTSIKTPIFDPFKSPTPKPTVKPSSKPTPKPTVKPSARPTPKPIVRPTPKPKPTLTTNSFGWVYVIIKNTSKEKSINIVPQNSVDLEEEIVYSKQDSNFIVIDCKIKYNSDIIIDKDSKQILLEDSNKKVYKLYAMSTYIFKYKGDDVSEKIETFLASKYYQLSTKDSRNTVSLVFEIPKNVTPKKLKILGYKDVILKN